MFIHREMTKALKDIAHKLDVNGDMQAHATDQLMLTILENCDSRVSAAVQILCSIIRSPEILSGLVVRPDDDTSKDLYARVWRITDQFLSQNPRLVKQSRNAMEQTP